MKNKNTSIQSVFTLLLILSFTSQSTYCAPTELAISQELDQTYKKETQKIDLQISKKEGELNDHIEALKKEPLFNELELGWQTLIHNPLYEKLTQTKVIIIFMKKVYESNKLLIKSDLLFESNMMIEASKGIDHLASTRPIIKKQRVALVEILEEADFLKTINKALETSIPAAETILSSTLTELKKLPEITHLKDVQEKYTKLSITKKTTALLNALENLENQKAIALLKNKPLQKLIAAPESADFRKNQHEQLEQTIEKQFKLNKELFFLPLEKLL